MALMGRVLQGAGWLWIAAGVASQITGFGELSWFPGVVLLFVARLLRTQARRTSPPEPLEPLELPKPTVPSPSVPKRQAPPPPPPPTEPTPEPAEAAQPAPSAPIASPASPPPSEPGHKPMTSDEMIAAARKRWDRPRR